MNRIDRKISLLMCMALSLLFSSCIYQDEVPCPCNVHFVYDYNMEYADAFPSQVNDVKLYVFDSNGRFVTLKEDAGTHLDAGYRMNLQLEPGEYTLVAWAGTKTDAACYNLNEHPATLQDLTLSLNTDGSGTYQKNPADLWHGILKNYTVYADAPSEGTIGLVKNTNRFKVLLQTADGTSIHQEDYSFSIIDANHGYEHNNELTEGLSPLTYLPYHQQEVSLENEAGSSRAATIQAVTAELATLRLMADRSPRFVVRNEQENKDIFNINLREYLDKMRFSEYASIPLQEFLDRENSYQVILVMGRDAQNNPVMLSLQIDAWRMVFNQSVLNNPN